MDLMKELTYRFKQLDLTVKELRVNGTKYAEAERDYKITLRTEALKLRNEKDMPVTLIQQVVYGVPEVAEKRFHRDVAEAIYKANLEAVNTCKIYIKILNEQISREWSNGT